MAVTIEYTSLSQWGINDCHKGVYMAVTIEYTSLSQWGINDCHN